MLWAEEGSIRTKMTPVNFCLKLPRPYQALPPSVFLGSSLGPGACMMIRMIVNALFDVYLILT